MSTSDRHEQGPLTRKQLREIRLTGSTPVITPEEAAAAAAASTSPAPTPPREDAPEITTAQGTEAPVDAVSPEDRENVGLTRRQIRERERLQAAAVETESTATDDDQDAEESSPAPVSAAASVDSVGAIPLDPAPGLDPAPDADDEPRAEESDSTDPVAAVAELGIEVEDTEDDSREDDSREDDSREDEREPDAAGDVLADADPTDDVPVVAEGERPTVAPDFGQGVLDEPAAADKPFAPSFDELLTVGDSTGSQRLAPNTLIFNPAPGEGSLSGPVASTGEILVTGSYELPQGLGSQGHAHGTTDGKDVDAVLIDGELPPASSPTPIAASSAVSTIKPAGEVIRPPAPEKGNKLMLTLAITAGGLALALAVALIVAFTTNVF